MACIDSVMEAQSQSRTTTAPVEEPSSVIVDLIADLEGVDPTDLSPPLYSVIDPDALNHLFHAPNDDTAPTPGHVCFTYRGYDVRIQSDGEVAILNR